MYDRSLTQLLAAWLMLLSVLAWRGAHSAASGEETQSLDSIREAAAELVYAQADQFPVPPQVSPGRLDSRLQLAKCDRPLESFAAPGGLRPGNSVVGVRCDGSQPWKLFVPVEIALPGKVVVGAHALRRGQILQPGDLRLEQVDLAEQHRGYFQSPARLIGKKMKRSVGRSTVLAPRMLTREKLVKRGGDVLIMAGGDRFSVRMKGKALGDGGRGDRIRVRNLSSGREISATVVETGLVEVSY